MVTSPQGCLRTLSGTLMALSPKGVLSARTVQTVLVELGASAGDHHIADVVSQFSSGPCYACWVIVNSACSDGALFSSLCAATGDVDVKALLRALKAASDANVASCNRLDQVFSQLQAGVVSSIPHMRKVFRELDVDRQGVITCDEFKAVLHRHNIDVGLSHADVLALMSRFPPAMDPRTGTRQSKLS
jgi:Ca2+-binding EF-hand superfamily protein